MGLLPGRVGVVDETQVVAAEAQDDELSGLEAAPDQVEIRVRVGRVEETVASDKPGAELVGAGAMFADVELKVDGRRLGGEKRVVMAASGGVAAAGRGSPLHAGRSAIDGSALLWGICAERIQVRGT